MIRRTNQKPRVFRWPEGLAWSALTLFLAGGILLAGFLLTLWLDVWLPSGKDVLTQNTSRNPLDDIWMQDTPSGEPLGVFPYDTASNANLKAVEGKTELLAQTGYEWLYILTNEMTSRWYSDPYVNRYEIKRAVSFEINEESIALEFAGADISDWNLAGVDDALYIGVLEETMPGLVAPDRWIAYRVTAARLLNTRDGETICEYRADAIFHPALGITHFFLHKPGEGFPSAFIRTDDNAPLQYVKAQASGFLEHLLQLVVYEEAYPDKILDAAWRSGGNTSLADLGGITSPEADGCYIADGLFAVSFPCGDNGHFYLFLEADTLNIRGFSRVYTS